MTSNDIQSTTCRRLMCNVQLRAGTATCVMSSTPCLSEFRQGTGDTAYTGYKLSIWAMGSGNCEKHWETPQKSLEQNQTKESRTREIKPQRNPQHAWLRVWDVSLTKFTSHIFPLKPPPLPQCPFSDDRGQTSVTGLLSGVLSPCPCVATMALRVRAARRWMRFKYTKLCAEDAEVRNLAGVTGSVQDDSSECSASPGVVRMIEIYWNNHPELVPTSLHILHTYFTVTPSGVEHLHLHSANRRKHIQISGNMN